MKKGSSFVHSRPPGRNLTYWTCISTIAGLCAATLLAKHPFNPGPDDPPIKFHLPAPKPLSAEDALKTFKLPPGFRIECVASEPMVEDPIVCSFHAQGRMWVVEFRGYMHDLEGAGEKDPVGRIKLLESTKHDGHYDKASIFLDGLVMPRAVLATRGGVLVGVPPELTFYKEVDGHAGEKTIVSTNFGVKGGQPESMANGLLPAIDNWIYNAAHTFRYRFTAGKWISEFVPSRGQWGIAQDDFGRLYYCSNTDLGRADPFPAHYFTRNRDYRAIAATNLELMPFKNQDVWPGHPTPGTNRGYTDTELRADGSLTRPTAACGNGIYRGDLFPPEFRNNLFTCEPAGNLVKRLIIHDEAGKLTATHAYDGIDFLTSSDERFRPVNITGGPDGALYVVDMYRGVIEHASFLTNYLIKNIKERDLLMPIHGGRIYRIVPEGAELKQPQFSKDIHALVKGLADANGFVRDMSQRLIVEKNDAHAVPFLESMLTTDANPLARLHALWTLEGMGRLEPEIIAKAMQDADPHIKIAAIRLSEPLLAPATRALAMPGILSLLDHPDPEVQLQLALTLGAVPDRGAEEAVAKLLTSTTADPDMMRDCVISGLHGRELEFLKLLLERPQWSKSSASFATTLASLSRCVIAEHHSTRVTELIQLTAAEEEASWRQIALLQGTMPPPLPPKQSPSIPTTTQPTIRPAVASTHPTTTRPSTSSTLPTTAPATTLRVKLIYLDAEPHTWALLLHSGNAQVRELSEKFDERLAWPGKPGVPERPKIVPLTAPQQLQFERGKLVYSQICAACHQPNGFGQEGLAPPLVDSEWVLGADARLVRIVLHGLNGPITVGGAPFRLEMPALATMPDEDIAAILTYVRREWEHDADPVSVDRVTKIRTATTGRTDLWTAKELLEVKE